MKLKQLIYWLTPLLVHSSEANAWGLVTHVYYAHSLLWAMPLLDPRLQTAIKRFPELVMTGSLVPDLAVVNHRFNETHQWHHAHRLLRSANSEQQIALAIGYASHLYVDVIAHNHFVPAHEATWLQHFKRKKPDQPDNWLKSLLKKHIKLSKWFNHSAMTHIMSEWAMDAHLSPLVDKTPSQLLAQHREEVEKFVGQHFNQSRVTITQSINRLHFWDGVLRSIRLPQTILWFANRLDQKLFKHFSYYIAKTQTAMRDFGQTVNGHSPSLAPELKGLDHEAESFLQKQCKADLDLLHPIPIDYYPAHAAAGIADVNQQSID